MTRALLLTVPPGRIQTCDTGFRRAVLYPLSYGADPAERTARGGFSAQLGDHLREARRVVLLHGEVRQAVAVAVVAQGVRHVAGLSRTARLGASTTPHREYHVRIGEPARGSGPRRRRGSTAMMARFSSSSSNRSPAARRTELDAIAERAPPVPSGPAPAMPMMSARGARRSSARGRRSRQSGSARCPRAPARARWCARGSRHVAQRSGMGSSAASNSS